MYPGLRRGGGRDGVFMSDVNVIQLCILTLSRLDTGTFNIYINYLIINQQKYKYELQHKCCHIALYVNVEKAQLPQMTMTGKTQDVRHS